LVNLVGLKEASQGIAFEGVPYNENYFNNKRMMFPFIFDDAENGDKQMFYLCLKRVPSQLLEGVMQCTFFKEEKREKQEINPNIPNHSEHLGSQYKGWCGVYSHRPTMCRTYPIGLNTETYQSFLIRREDAPQAAKNKALHLCPKSELSLQDFGLDNQDAYMNKMNEVLLNEARNQAHNQAVQKWNSQPKRSVKNVIPFIQKVGKTSILVKSQVQVNKPNLTPEIISSASKAIKQENAL
jgi:Fe-S-cluster containining protein